MRGTIDPVLQNYPQLELEIWPYELNPWPNERTVLSEQYKAILENKVRPWTDKYGFDLNTPSIPKPYTNTAFVGLLFAEKNGKAWDYMGEVCRSFWAEGKDISDKGILAKIAAGVGLNEIEFAQAVEDKTLHEEHRRRLQQAYDYDKVPLNYIPHLEMEGRHLEGIFDQEQLREFLEGK